MEAEALFEAGHVTAARDAYVRLHAGSACATNGLLEIKELMRLCDLGHADLRAHRGEDALAAFKAALAKDPRAECATAGVREARPDKFSRALQWLAGAVPRIPLVLGALVVLSLLILTAVGWVASHINLGGRPLLDRLWVVRTLLRPRVTLATIADEGVQWDEGGPQWKSGTLDDRTDQRAASVVSGRSVEPELAR
jgi:hypothetical protein